MRTVRATLLTLVLILAKDVRAESTPSTAGARKLSNAEQILPGEFAVEANAGGEITTPLRGACSAGSSALREARAKVEDTGRILQALSPEGDIEAFHEAYLELTRHPCLRGLGIFEFEFRWQSPEVVKTWWAVGGAQWIHSNLELGPDSQRVVLPPDIPREAAPGLEALRCVTGEDCLTALAWRQRMDAELNAMAPSIRTSQLEQECPIPADREPDDRFRDWLLCASERVGRRIELPEGLYRPPTEGWLTLRYVEPSFGKTCGRTGVYSLTNGDAWELNGCNGNVSRVGRVPVEVARDVALLLALLKDVRFSARAQAREIALPADLQPVWREHTDGEIIVGVTNCVIGGWPSHELNWRVLTNGTDLSGVTTHPGSEEGPARILRPWTTRLKKEFRTGCVAGPTPPSASLALLSQYGDAEAEVEKRETQALQALLSRPANRCGNTARSARTSPRD